ncbi:MAG: phosphatase PAP2 family protein [Candidatus Colwellbacteria bacterium]|nr:phosphatase PAP2 family protein [Candidatus Colwellbacteria bacterium]
MTSFDEGIFYAVYSITHRSVLVDGVIVFFAKYLAWILIAVIVFKLFQKKDWGEKMSVWKNRFQTLALGLLAVILSRGIVANFLQSFITSPRPFAALNIEPLFNHLAVNSLPSGHMALLIPIALTGFILSRKTGWWGVLLTLLIGLARVMAGIHWPSDIVAGILIGAVSFGCVYFLFKKRGLLQL